MVTKDTKQFVAMSARKTFPGWLLWYFWKENRIQRGHLGPFSVTWDKLFKILFFSHFEANEFCL